MTKIIVYKIIYKYSLSTYSYLFYYIGSVVTFSNWDGFHIVDYTDKGRQIIILDISALVSLAGKSWLILETNIDGAKTELRMVKIGSNHYGLVLEAKSTQDRDALYLAYHEEKLTSFHYVRKVNKINNHKGTDQQISTYDKASWMSLN